MAVRIADLVPQGEVEVWVECPDVPGFEVCFAHKPASEWRRLWRKAVRRRWDSQAREVVEDTDDDALQRIIATEVIRGWRGLTVARLAELLPAVAEALEAGKASPDDEIPYSPENALELLDRSLAFQGWVADVMTRVEEYARKSHEAEAKNSSSRRSGTSPAATAGD